MTNGTKLVKDFENLVTHTEELVNATVAQGGEKIADLRSRVQRSLAEVRPRLQHAQTIVRERATAAAATADDYVHEKPWPVIGLAAGVGLLVGLLIGRR